MKKETKKEKVIQIALVEGNPNPYLLTNKGRVLMVDTTTTPIRWVDISIDLSKVQSPQ